jgi:hypothetical protein
MLDIQTGYLNVWNFFIIKGKCIFWIATLMSPAVNMAVLRQLVTYFKLTLSWYYALISRYANRRKWLPLGLCKHRKSGIWEPKTHFLFWEYFHCFTGSCTTHCSPFASPVDGRHTSHCVEHEVGLTKRLLSRASVLDSLSVTAGKDYSCHMMSHSWKFCLTDNINRDLSQWKMMQFTVIGVIPIVPSRAG